MQFNSHADDQDCVTEILKICGTTVNGYSLKDLTRRFNAGTDRYCQLAFEADKRHSFDDILQSSPPIDTQNLVSGTNRYKFDTFTEKIINLLELEVLDSNGKGLRLIPETIDGIDDSVYERYINAPTTHPGTPTHYLKYGDFVYLHPSPNYSETGGLRAYFSRTNSYLASTATTTVPGVPAIHHFYLCRYAALPYLIEKKLPQAEGIAALIAEDERQIMQYFSRRSEDDKPRLEPLKEDNK